MAITIVGDLSRTWYSDRDLLLEVLVQSWEEDPDLRVVVHGAAGFDVFVIQWVEGMGVPVISFGPKKLEDRFHWKAPPGQVLENCELLLVLPRRGKKKDVWEVDPVTIEAALALDIPVLAMDEEGRMKSWP